MLTNDLINKGLVRKRKECTYIPSQVGEDLIVGAGVK